MNGPSGFWRRLVVVLGLLLGVSAMRQAVAQAVTPVQVDLQLDAPAKAPQGKGSTGELPMDSPAVKEANDTSVLSGAAKSGAAKSGAAKSGAAKSGAAKSGVEESQARGVLHLSVGAEIRMHTLGLVSSGSVGNGAVISGVLDAPVRTTAGGMLPRGAKVDGTVVSAAKAGVIQSGGVLSLQLTRVAGIPVITDVRDFTGVEGHKDVADSRPAKGEEAVVRPEMVLTFKVLETGRVPGMPE